MSFPSILGVAIVVFATTNIDDIFLLAAFFADRTLAVRSIVLGQFAGIGALTAVSGVAALLALAIPDGWIGLLGLAPLILGCMRLYALGRDMKADAREDDEDDGPDKTETDTAVVRSPDSSRAQWLAVASVTIANGGDNLGVYIPLFSRQIAWIPLYAIVFAVMTALWCTLGYGLVNHPLLGARIRQYGHIALPFVLITLGLHILWDTRALFV